MKKRREIVGFEQVLIVIMMKFGNQLRGRGRVENCRIEGDGEE